MWAVILVILAGSILVNTTPAQASEWVRVVGFSLFTLGSALGLYSASKED